MGLMVSASGDGVLLKEKLLSIPDHLTNKHSFEGNLKYKECAHDELEASADKPWLKEESLVRILLLFLKSGLMELLTFRLFIKSRQLFWVTKTVDWMTWI